MNKKQKKSHPLWGAFFVLSGFSQLSYSILISLILILIGMYLIAPNWFVYKIQNIFGNLKSERHQPAHNIRYNTKSDLLRLQRLVCPGEHKRLIMSKSQLYMWADNICQQKLKILNESANLVNTTKKPQVFFERYDLLYQTAKELVPFEEFVNFTGKDPTHLIIQFDIQRDHAIMNLIERAYEAATQKASEMKTEKGRRNQFAKMFDSFAPYKDEFSDEAKQYLIFLKESVNAQIGLEFNNIES